MTGSGSSGVGAPAVVTCAGRSCDRTSDQYPFENGMCVPCGKKRIEGVEEEDDDDDENEHEGKEDRKAQEQVQVCLGIPQGSCDREYVPGIGFTRGLCQRCYARWRSDTKKKKNKAPAVKCLGLSGNQCNTDSHQEPFVLGFCRRCYVEKGDDEKRQQCAYGKLPVSKRALEAPLKKCPGLPGRPCDHDSHHMRFKGEVCDNCYSTKRYHEASSKRKQDEEGLGQPQKRSTGHDKTEPSGRGQTSTVTYSHSQEEEVKRRMDEYNARMQAERSARDQLTNVYLRYEEERRHEREDAAELERIKAEVYGTRGQRVILPEEYHEQARKDKEALTQKEVHKSLGIGTMQKTSPPSGKLPNTDASGKKLSQKLSIRKLDSTATSKASAGIQYKANLTATAPASKAPQVAVQPLKTKTSSPALTTKASTGKLGPAPPSQLHATTISSTKAPAHNTSASKSSSTVGKPLTIQHKTGSSSTSAAAKPVTAVHKKTPEAGSAKKEDKDKKPNDKVRRKP